jgi:DNA relaxase NicK
MDTVSGPIEPQSTEHNQAESNACGGRLRAHSPVSSPPPPPTNRGVEIGKGVSGEVGVPAVSLHWASLTFRGGVAPERVAEFLTERMPGLTWIVTDRQGQGYRSVVLGSLAGVRILHNPVDGGRHFHLTLPGEACEALGVAGILAVAALGDCRASRIDVALDAPEGRTPSPTDLYNQWMRDRSAFRTYAKQASLIQSSDGSSTCYIGSRQSETYVRIYDRREGVVRFEAELKGDRASAALRELAACGLQRARETMLGLMRRAVDFVESVGDAVTRAPLAAWWAALVESARVAAAIAAVPRTVEASLSWVRSACAGTLKGLLVLLGGDLSAFHMDRARIPLHLQMAIESASRGALMPDAPAPA